MARTKTALHVALTLGFVGMIYASPWVIAAVGAFAPRPTMEAYEGGEDRFAEAVWVPVHEEPDVAETEDDAGTDVSSQEVASVDAVAPVTALVAPVGTVVPGLSEGASVAAPVAVVAKEPVAAPKKRRVRRPRVARAPRELTKKQQRRRKRRKRQRERMAEQPQCHELIDQIVPVSEGEWWVGRELVSCYRSHPRQFARIGGMQWVEDSDDKRVGLKLYVSTRSRGDIARAVGFHRGDILRSLNGIPLRSTAGSSFAAVQLLGNRAKLKFLRDGKEHKVVLRVVGDAKLERARDARRVAQLIED